MSLPVRNNPAWNLPDPEDRPSADSPAGTIISTAKRLRSWKLNASLLLLSTLISLGLLEIGVRIFWDRLTTRELYSDRPTYYYEPERPFHFSDFKFEDPKPPGVFRLAVVGDSFTFPPFMQFDDAFPNRLNRMLNLNDQTQPGRKAEVINYGAWGASTYAEKKTLQKVLNDRADFVLLEITLNDPQFNPYTPKNKALQGKYTFGELEITRETTPLYYYWRTLGLVAKRIHNSKSRESVIRYHRQLFEDEEHWKAFTKALRAMRAMCRHAHVPFVAVVFPFIHYSMDEGYPFRDIHGKITDFLTSANIPNLDLLPAFAHIPSDRLIVAPGIDNHPNEIAHRIVAESTYNWLESQHYIPDDFVIKSKFIRRGTHSVTGERSAQGSPD